MYKRQKLIFKYPDVNFEIKDATIDRMVECDMYLLAYQHDFENFIAEKLVESKLCLLASSSYLELMGEPKKLNDMLEHKVIRPERSDILLGFAGCMYGPIFHKKNATKVDTLTSLISLGESMGGIICYAEHLLKYSDVKLEIIPEVGGEYRYVNYTLGFHEKLKNDPIVNYFRCELLAKLTNPGQQQS